MTAIPRASRAVIAATVVFIAAGVVVLIGSSVLTSSQTIANGAWVAVGALIVLRRPGNIIGVVVLLVGLLLELSLAGSVLIDAMVEDGRLVGAGWLAVVAGMAFPFVIWLLIPLMLLFPDGRAASPRGTRFLEASSGYVVVTAITTMLGEPQTVTSGKLDIPHPFVSDGVASSMTVIGGTLLLGLVVMGLIAAGLLVARMRRSGPIERRQLRWLAYGATVGFGGELINQIVHGFAPSGDVFLVVDSMFFILPPLAIGVAITRYRLYEIDRIISRSVTVGALAVFIGGVYVGIVVGVGALIPGGAGFWLQVVASVVVAMAFQPARRRVQRWANRLVYGERATPYEVLVRFSRRSAELSDEELLLQIPRLIVDGTGAATAALWTRNDRGFRTAAAWPEGSAKRQLPDVSAFVDPEADHSSAVFHDGELLGGLSLVKPGGESVTPLEEALLADLASGLGLSLRNARLTAQLRRQVAELEVSRERVLAASDAAKRALENDLDSGPQQTLVAVKVKLGPTRKRAEQLGAAKTAGLLAQLEHAAGEAISAVREFAGGIYPPLLEAEGLTVAIGQQARMSAIPVSVHGDGIRRYPREVEAAVYFSVLEALQNTAKYAAASSATVALATHNGSLTFEVRDDGHGFDATTVARGAGLTGIADRLDTVGGTIHIDSTPGQGTRVMGTVPIQQIVPA